MPILRSMDGKFYDLPDEHATQYEMPREKVKEILEKSGEALPVAHGGTDQKAAAKTGQPAPQQGAAAPVVIQVYTGAPGAGPAPQAAPQGAAQGAQGAPQDADGSVDPYWIVYRWWTNYYIYRPWGNWGNW